MSRWSLLYLSLSQPDCLQTRSVLKTKEFNLITILGGFHFKCFPNLYFNHLGVHIAVELSILPLPLQSHQLVKSITMDVSVNFKPKRCLQIIRPNNKFFNYQIWIYSAGHCVGVRLLEIEKCNDRKARSIIEICSELNNDLELFNWETFQKWNFFYFSW